jgi:protein-S-isoprenylcysteine O-methyltransferase Ste14
LTQDVSAWQLSLLGAGLVVWCTLHSALISTTFARFIENRIGAAFRFYRIAYNVFALATLIPLVVYERSLEASRLFSWSGWLRAPQLILLGAAAILFIGGGLHFDLRHFVGVRQLQAAAPDSGTRLETGGMLGWTRHPWYAGALLLLWARPMDAADLVVNGVLTLYLVIGTHLEERKLIREFGESYRDYQRRVPMFFPTGVRRRDVSRGAR